MQAGGTAGAESTPATPADRGNGFARAWGEFVVRYRWLMIAGTVLFALAAGYGGQFLNFSTNYEVYFGPQNPDLKAYQAVQKVYTKNDNLMFVVTAKDGTIFTAKRMAAVEELTRRAWKLRFSRRVDSITNFQHTRAADDELVVRDLIKNAAARTPAELEAARKVVLTEPLLKDRLLRPASNVTGVNVTLILPVDDPQAILQLVDDARMLASDIEKKYPGVSIRLTGIAMLNHAFVEVSRTDMASLLPISLAIILLFMALLLRSLLGMTGALLVVILSVIAAMGIGGWMGIRLSPPSVQAPMVILTLAIADSIHFLVTMFQEMRRGTAKRAAIVESLRINLMPIVLTSVTTAIGFLVMNFSDSPPFHDLGNIVAIGIMAALLFSVTFLPALMAVLPVKAKAAANMPGTGLMDRVADFTIRRRTPLFISLGVIILGLCAFIPRLELNDRFVQYFDKTIQFRQDADYTQANLTGMYVIEFSMAGAKPGAKNASNAISDPAYLKNLESFVTWLRAQPEVVHVNTLTDIMKRLNKNMHNDDPAKYTLPADRKLAAQYLLLYEMSLPQGLELNDQVDINKSSTRVVVTLKDLSAVAMRAFEAKANKWIRENLPAHMQATNAGYNGRATGPNLMFAHISERNINSMLFGTVLALVLISFLLILALRSVRIGLVSLIPNLAPAAMAFGAWAIFVQEVNLAAAVLTAMTLGIVVDDTIHFLSKYLRARREQNATAEEAVRYAFRTVGWALVVTTTVLTAGFLVMAFSSFAINSVMGLMTAITIVIALIADFFFLAPLLLFIDRKKQGSSDVQSADAAAAA